MAKGDTYIDENTDPIDLQNAKSYKFIYIAVFIFWIATGIWFGFTIKQANEDGASDPANFAPAPEV